MHPASPVYMATRITVLLLLSWLSETASGGCTRYGHACWGGHGKRSGGLTGRDIGVGPSSGALDGSAVWTPADYVLASHRMRNGGSPAVAVSDMLAPSGVAPSNDAGQDDDDVPAPRDLLVMSAGDPADQEQLHLYKILNRSTRKVN